MQKKGKRRWLALRKGTLMWFAEERVLIRYFFFSRRPTHHLVSLQKLDEIDPANAKGSIQVRDYRAAISDVRFLFHRDCSLLG